jgi:hypothetical protein
MLYDVYRWVGVDIAIDARRYEARDFYVSCTFRRRMKKKKRKISALLISKEQSTLAFAFHHIDSLFLPEVPA